MNKFGRKYTNIGTDNHPVWELLPDECEPAETGAVKPLIKRFKKSYKNRGINSNPVLQFPRPACLNCPSLTTEYDSTNETITYTLEGDNLDDIDHWTIDTTTYTDFFFTRSKHMVGKFEDLHSDTPTANPIPSELSDILRKEDTKYITS